MLKKLVMFMMLITSICLALPDNTHAKADMTIDSYSSQGSLDIVNNDTSIYSVYDENFMLVFQKDYVEVGDGYMSPDRKYYEVVYVDQDKKIALANFVRFVELPKVDVSFTPKPITVERRVVCMYMSHNDECYVPSDGVDSVYGNGGIKDVALAFKKCLENNLITVQFDDALHIPHDTKAYSRSKQTAEKLYEKYKPDAIFDIHRDATSRRFYVADVNGKEQSKVRIVLGKSNPNMKINEEFALYVVAVANELYPWLITDIYYGNGHYNQSIDGKALLFEMGTYLIEKDLVIDSMDELAEVVTTALYNTTVNESTGDLTINGVEDKENVIINEYIEEKQKSNYSALAISIAIVIMASVSSYAIFLLAKNLRKSKIMLNNSNKNDKI